MSKKNSGGFLRCNFSLNPDYSHEISQFTMLADNANRSDVIKAAIAAFRLLPDKRKKQLIEQAIIETRTIR